MFLRGAGARRGFVSSLLSWKRAGYSSDVLGRGFGGQVAAEQADFHWQVDESVPGFEPLWSKIEARRLEGNVAAVVTDWKNEGNEMTKELLHNVLYKLCARGWSIPANQLADWLDAQKLFELNETEQISRLEVACLLRKSWSKVSLLRDSFGHKSEASYLVLLKSYTNDARREGAEQVFRELKASGLMVTGRAYKLMLKLYVRLRDEPQALRFLKKYKGSELPPEAGIYCLLFEHRETIFSSIRVEQYASEAVRKLRVAGKITSANMRDVMKLYAYLGDAGRVDKIWEQMLANPPVISRDFVGALTSYGILGNVSKAEKISTQYEDLEDDRMRYLHASSMLRLYARNGKLDKALQMQAQIPASKLHFEQVQPIIDGYLKQGELQQAAQCFQSYFSSTDRMLLPWKLIADSVVKLNEKFALTGDVKSAEKLMAAVPKMQLVSAYKSLMKVYLSAKTVPTYGLPDRMLAARVALDDEADMLLEQLASLEGDHSAKFLSCHVELTGGHPVEASAKVNIVDVTGVEPNWGTTFLFQRKGIVDLDEFLHRDKLEPCIKNDILTVVATVTLECRTLCNELTKPRADLGDKLFAMLENGASSLQSTVQGFFPGHDQRPCVFQAMIEFAYKDIVHGNHDVPMARKLLVAADRYKMEGLKGASTRLLSDNINKENVFSIMALADRCQAASLKEDCFQFVCTHANEMVRSPDFIFMAFMVERGADVRVPWWEQLCSYLKSTWITDKLFFSKQQAKALLKARP